MPVCHSLHPESAEIGVIASHRRVLKIKPSESWRQAFGLKRHQVFIEAAHRGPHQYLPMFEFVEEASLLEEVQEGILYYQG